MLDLSLDDDRKALADLIKSDIDEFCIKKYGSEHRDHLGASIMGKPCSRDLWYGFRWVKKEKFSGRVLRLFDVGHRAEPRFIEYLRGIGFEVKEFDPENEKQFRISGVDGHYGGSLDGMCKAPERYNIREQLIFLNEFKTNGTGSGFVNVGIQDLIKAKPTHYDQMCQYGAFYKLKYGVYLIENKNDSDLIVKIVALDWNRGAELHKKAEDIIRAKIPPNKIALNSSYFDCKYCNHNAICHFDEPVEINCRSCKYAEPVANAEWQCNYWKQIIPSDYIKAGCPLHISVNVI